MESDNPIESILRNVHGRDSQGVTLGSKDGAIFRGGVTLSPGIVCLNDGGYWGHMTPKGGFKRGTLKIPSEQVAWVFFNRL
jgi:hypothetical protein